MSHHRPHDPHCIFCKIVTRRDPLGQVLETAEAVAFLDINPVNPGHTLLVPKAHHAHLGDLPDASPRPPARSCPGSAAPSVQPRGPTA